MGQARHSCAVARITGIPTKSTLTPFSHLLRYRTVFHSAVCLAELTHAFGRLDPGHRATKAALKAITGTIKDIARHRLFAPDVDIWGKAGMLAGKALRLGGIPAGREEARKLLNNNLIHLQAREVGAAILTRNVRDFELLEQLVPSGAVIVYKQEQRVQVRAGLSAFAGCRLQP